MDSISLRELFPKDLAEPKPPGGSTLPALKRIRAVHHQAARLLATGMAPGQVSLTTGLCPSRISILQRDPSFSELVAHYRELDEEIFLDVRGQVAALGTTAAQVLHDRLLESPEDVSTKDLTQLLSTALDRGGYAPVQKTISTTTNLGPEELEALREALGSAPRRSRVIEGAYAQEGVSGVPTSEESSLGVSEPEAAVPAEAPTRGSGTGTGI